MKIRFWSFLKYNYLTYLSVCGMRFILLQCSGISPVMQLISSLMAKTLNGWNLTEPHTLLYFDVWLESLSPPRQVGAERCHLPEQTGRPAAALHRFLITAVHNGARLLVQVRGVSVLANDVGLATNGLTALWWKIWIQLVCLRQTELNTRKLLPVFLLFTLFLSRLTPVWIRVF